MGLVTEIRQEGFAIAGNIKTCDEKVGVFVQGGKFVEAERFTRNSTDGKPGSVNAALKGLGDRIVERAREGLAKSSPEAVNLRGLSENLLAIIHTHPKFIEQYAAAIRAVKFCGEGYKEIELANGLGIVPDNLAAEEAKALSQLQGPRMKRLSLRS